MLSNERRCTCTVYDTHRVCTSHQNGCVPGAVGADPASCSLCPAALVFVLGSSRLLAPQNKYCVSTGTPAARISHMLSPPAVRSVAWVIDNVWYNEVVFLLNFL